MASSGVPSPCVNVCRINPRTLWCDGCLRRIEEITDWALLSDDAKRAVWRALDQRRSQVAGRASTSDGPADPTGPATTSGSPL